MTCTEFDSIVVEIARGRPVDAALRGRSEAHALGCERCGERLRDERAVTDHLAGLRAATRTVAAPAELEGALVAAFRARDEVGRSAATSWRWLGVAAALALVGAGATVARWAVESQRTPPGRAPEVAEAAASAPVDAPAVAPSRALAEAGRVAGVEPSSRAVSTRAATRSRPAAVRRQTPGAARVGYASLPATLPRWSDEPLVPVRVQVPSAALPALGLQLTRERWGESVPVEVLVGIDGIARGIRLVDNESLDR